MSEHCNDYPSDEDLEKIKTWESWNIQDYHKFMAFIQTLWHWPDFFKRNGNTYTLYTGGWSGNEDIIHAMHSNFIFWAMYFDENKRNSRYKFIPIKDAMNGLER